MKTVKVTLENGESYNTSMSERATDEQILQYFAPGTVINHGLGPEDNPQKIAAAEIVPVIINGYKITYSDFWHRWQVGHPEIAPVVDEFQEFPEAIEYAEKG